MRLSNLRGYLAHAVKHPFQPLLPIYHSPSLRRLDGNWPQEFSNTDLLDHQFPNVPITYIDALRAVWKEVDNDVDERIDSEAVDGEENDEDSEDVPKEDQNPAGVFMKNRTYAPPSETNENWHAGAQLLCTFCHNSTFDSIYEPDEDSENLAYLEDGSRAGVFEESSGPLSPLQLQQALGAPRFHHQLAGDSSIAPSMPCIDQRRLCFLNIAPKMASVLMNTTAEKEAPAVQDLLYRHIGRASFLGVTVPSRGVETFTFHLSIPFYSLQRGPHAKDDRRLGDKLLRSTLSIPNLGDFQEAHTSIMLTGHRDWKWTAIALIDNVSYTDHELPPGCRRDHIAGVNIFPMHTPSNARPYFLWAWKERLDQILKHWTEAVDTIIRAVDERIQDDLAIMASKCNDNKIEKLAAAIDEVAQWAMHLDPMKKKLRSMLDDWNNFRQPDGGGKYFEDECTPPENASGQGPRNSFGTLKALYSSGALLLKKLEDATSTLEGKLNQLHFAHGTSTKALADRQAKRVAIVQEEAAKYARRASVTTMCFLPAMVAFTLFSMEKTAIPIAVTRESLLAMLGVLGLLTVILFNCVDLIVDKGGGLGSLVKGFVFRLFSVPLQKPEDALV